MREVSIAAARRIALAAQGFAAQGFTARTPTARTPTARTLLRSIESMGVLQIDSVNVFVRSHYVPLFSRLGPYRMELLDRLAYRDRALYEGWAHEASLIPVRIYPLFRWTMDPAHRHPRWQAWARTNAKRIEAVYREVSEGGPTGVSGLAEPGKRGGPWWDWAFGKTALEYLFANGRLAVAGRRNFERLYDLTERVIPADVLATPAVPEPDARRRLLAIAARALGVATAFDLAWYFKMKLTPAKRAIADLVDDGTLEPVRVEGWPQPAFLARGATVPRTLHARAILTPFDPVCWWRDRMLRLFDFRYQIEIYTPEPKRIHGYYVLPFLHGDRLAARVDLKADRKEGALVVKAAWLEPDAAPGETAAALAEELLLAAAWLGLPRVRVERKGTLATRLARHCRAVQSDA